MYHCTTVIIHQYCTCMYMYNVLYCVLTVLLLFQPQGELQLEDTNGAITVCHCLAMGAFDYNKKNCVLRVTTSDWHSFLLQAK